MSLCALHDSPDHIVTAVLSLPVHCIAVVVRGGQLEEPAGTTARGRVQPAVHLQTQSQREGATLRSYKLSETPEHPSRKADAGPVPSMPLFPPLCS